MIKGVRGILVIACMLVAAPAAAGTVYRCATADGASSFSSERLAGAKCTVVSSFKPPTTVAATDTTPAASGNAPRRVTGQVYSYVKDGARHYTTDRPRGR